ncbi:MAG: hypothetical protein ACREBE_08120, partial [bacterium]
MRHLLQATTPLPTPPVPPTLPAQGIDQLLAFEQTLQSQLLVLRAQRAELLRQSRNNDRGTREAAQSALIPVNAQINGIQSQLVGVSAQINSRLTTRPGYAGRPQNYNNNPNNGISGDNVAVIFVVFMLAVLMPLALGFTRRMWRRAPIAAPTQSEDVIAPRLDRLEQAVDAIAIEIERISEGQRFVTKVMTERPTASRPAE